MLNLLTWICFIATRSHCNESAADTLKIRFVQNIDFSNDGRLEITNYCRGTLRFDFQKNPVCFERVCSRDKKSFSDSHLEFYSGFSCFAWILQIRSA